VSVGADVSAALSNLSALENQVTKTASGMQAAAPAALLLSAAGAAVGAGFLSSINVAADFEHQMSAVKSVMTTDEVAQFGAALSDLGLKLGRDTVFTSRQAASAIEELIKAGVPAEAVLNGAAAAALNLAAATGVTTSDAATIAAQAMNVFGISAGQLTSVVDRLAAVANASASDVTFLRFGLAAVGGVAAGAGLSFDDTAVALGLLSNRFASGSDAGTSFKAFLNGLTPDSEKQISLFHQLGLDTGAVGDAFFDSAGHMKSFEQVAGVLRGALSGLNDMQRQQVLTTLFGTDGQRAANAVFDLGAEKVKTFSEQTGLSGVAAESAKTRMDNLQGALNNLGGSVETVQIIVGNLFLPKLRELADLTRGVVDRFSTLDPSLQRAAVLFVGVAGATAAALGGFVLLAPFITQVGPAFAALVSVLPRLLAVFGPLGIAAAILATDLGGIRTALGHAFSGAGTILSNFGTVFQKIVNGDVGGAVDTFQAILGALVPGLGPILANVRTAVTGFFDTFGPVFSNFGLVFQKVLAGDLGGAFDTFRAIVGTVSEPLGGLLGVFQNIGGVIRDTILPKMGELADQIMPTLGQLGGALGQAWDTVLSPALAKVGGWLSTILPLFAKLANGVLPALQTTSETLATFWDEKMQPAFKKVGDFIDSNLLTSLTNLATGLGGLSGDKVGQVAAVFGTTLGDALESFGTQLAPLLPIFQAVGGFLGSLANLFGTIVNVAGNTMVGLIQTVLVTPLQVLLDVFKSPANQAAMQSFTGLLSPLGAGLQALQTNAGGIADFFNGLAGGINALAEAIGRLPQVLPPWLQGRSLPDWLGSIGAGVGATGPNGGPLLRPASLNLEGAGAGAGGVIINFNAPIDINGEVGLQDFLDQMAAVIAAAANRVSLPPASPGFPQLNSI
jgi:TP901 family phage tail tape measure protein